MAFKVGRSRESQRVSQPGRVPLNYYRTPKPETGVSPFAKRPKKKPLARKFFVRVLDLAVLIIILYGLVYSLLVRAQPKVLVNDTSYHSLGDYKSAAAQQLGLFKNRNKISLDEQGIVKALQKKFPEIESGSVELPLFSETATIQLNVAKPSFFLSNSGVNYIVDSAGTATSTARALPLIKNLATLSDQSGFPAYVGEQVLSSGSVNFINTILEQMVRAKIPVSSLVLPAQADELDLHTSDRGYYVKFFLDGDPLLQTGQFLAARHNFDQTGKQPSAYLDVRVSGKIFYK